MLLRDGIMKFFWDLDLPFRRYDNKEFPKAHIVSGHVAKRGNRNL